MAPLARTASIAGLVSLVSILAVEVVVPSAVAGTPISGTLDRDTIAAYYRHPGLDLVLGLALFVVVLPAFVVFAVTIRELVAEEQRARYWGTLGSAFALCAVPIYIVKGAISAALVGIVGQGADPLPLFRVYDLAYNGAIYPLEAAYVFCLGWALVAMGAGRGWLRWLTIAVAAVQLLNSFVLFLGLPSAAAVPGNIAFSVWLGATSVALWRLEPVRDASVVPAPA